MAHGRAQQSFPTRSVQKLKLLEPIVTEMPWLRLRTVAPSGGLEMAQSLSNGPLGAQTKAACKESWRVQGRELPGPRASGMQVRFLRQRAAASSQLTLKYQLAEAWEVIH